MTEVLLGRSHHIQIPSFFSGYSFDQIIGQGSFSIVISVIRVSDNQRFACKVLSQKFLVDHKIVDKFKREVEIFQSLNHSNIVRLVEMVSDDKLIYLIMEYCAKGDLYHFVASKGGLPDTTARLMFRQIVSAVRYLHSKSIVHRDLKLENILLDSSLSIRLADFGFCREVPANTLLTTKCGSPAYTAPEVISQSSYNGQMADMWSLGVILFVILTGRIPWDAQNDTQLFFQIQTAHFHIPEYICASAANLIGDLMHPQPEMRLSAEQALNHPWLDDTGFRSYSTPGSLILTRTIIPELFQHSALPKTKGSAISLQNNHKHRLSMRENPILTRRILPLTEYVPK